MRYFQNPYTSVRKENVETAIDHTGCLQKNLRPFQNNQTSFNFFPVSPLTIVTVSDTLRRFECKISLPSHFLKKLHKHTSKHAKIKVNTTSTYNLSPATSSRLKDNVLYVLF